MRLWPVDIEGYNKSPPSALATTTLGCPYQFRAPTLAEDLADACIQAAFKRATGIYHVSGMELMSILEIAYKVADFFRLDKSYIKPVTSVELNQPAKRPLVTGFVLDKAKNDLNYHPHSFDEALIIIAEQLEGKLNKKSPKNFL